MVKAINIQIFTNSLGKREDIIFLCITSQLRLLKPHAFTNRCFTSRIISTSVKWAGHIFTHQQSMHQTSLQHEVFWEHDLLFYNIFKNDLSIFLAILCRYHKICKLVTFYFAIFLTFHQTNQVKYFKHHISSCAPI